MHGLGWDVFMMYGFISIFGTVGSGGRGEVAAFQAVLEGMLLEFCF